VRLVAIVQHKQRKGYGLRLNNFIEAEPKDAGSAFSALTLPPKQ